MQALDEERDRDIWKAWMVEAKAMTMENLPGFLEKLRSYDHDYGTICHAIAAAGIERSRMKRQLEAADRLAEMVKHHLTLLYDKDSSPEDIQDAEATLHCRLKTYRDARGKGEG